MKFLLSVALVFFASGFAFSQWGQKKGPSGPTTNIVKSGEAIFLNARFGIYKSIDHGANWTLVSDPLGPDLSVYSIDEENGVIYASTSRGIVYSQDAGSSWVITGTTSIASYHILVSGLDIFVPDPNGGLHYSPDNGETWQFKNPVPSAPIQGITKINDALWIGTSQGVYSSSDNGTTWVKNGLVCTNLNLLSYSDGVLIAARDGHAFASNNEGISWNELALPFSFNRFFSFIKNGNEFFLAHANGIYRSNDNGTTWIGKPFPTFRNIWYDTYVLLDQDALLVSGGDGVLSSIDKGDSWVERNHGLKNGYILDIVSTSLNVTALEAYTGLFLTNDNGLSWSGNLNDDGARDLYEFNDTIFFADWGKVFRSTDYGNTWQTILAFGPNNSENVFDGEGRNLILSSNNAVFFSNDMGSTWKQKETDASHVYPAAHIDGDTILLAMKDEIVISTDFGSTWQTTNHPEYFLPADFVFTKSQLFLATYQGLFYSNDLGISWTKIECVPFQMVTDIDFFGGNLIIATDIGVFVSSDGMQWFHSKDGWPGGFANCVKVTNSFVFAGSRGTGMWARPTIEVFAAIGNGESIAKPVLTYNCGTLSISNYTEGSIRWYSGSSLLIEGVSSLEVTANGTYYVEVAIGCLSVSSDPIVVNNVPMNLVVSRHCNTLRLGDNFAGTMQWYRNSEILSGEDSQDITITEVGEYYLQIDDGCNSRSNTISITGLFSRPNISRVSCFKIEVADAPSDALMVWWRNGDLIGGESGTQLVTAELGNYNVAYEECPGELSEPFVISDEKNPIVYNAVTSNEDGKNDYFMVDDALQGAVIKIFNRWGREIYQNDNYRNDWDPPADLPSGEYFYMVTHSCQGKFFGVLTIFK